MKSIGDKLKLLRQSNKITQKELSKLINKSVSTIQKYESGSVVPSMAILKKISEIFNIDMDYFTSSRKFDTILAPSNASIDELDESFFKQDEFKIINDVEIKDFMSVVVNYKTKIKMLSFIINETNDKKLIYSFNNLIDELSHEIKKKEETIRQLEERLAQEKDNRTFELLRLGLDTINLVETDEMKVQSYEQTQTAHLGPLKFKYKRIKDTNAIVVEPNIIP